MSIFIDVTKSTDLIKIGAGIGVTPFSGILADLQAKDNRLHGGPSDFEVGRVRKEDAWKSDQVRPSRSSTSDRTVTNEKPATTAAGDKKSQGADAGADVGKEVNEKLASTAAKTESRRSRKRDAKGQRSKSGSSTPARAGTVDRNDNDNDLTLTRTITRSISRIASRSRPGSRRGSRRNSLSGPPVFASDYRRVDFHWMVRDKNHLGWFSNLLNTISRSQIWHRSHDENAFPHLDIRLSTHVTQKRKEIVTHVYRWMLELHRTEEHPESPLTGLLNPTHYGRPDFVKILDRHYEEMVRFRQETRCEDDKLKVGVFFCGTPVVGEILADRCRLLTNRGEVERTRIRYHFMIEVFG